MGILKAKTPSTSKEMSSVSNPCISLCDMDDSPFQNWGCSSLTDNKSALPTISTKEDFPIPWHKLDGSVLCCLNGNTSLPLKDKGSLAKTICTDYLQWDHKTSVTEDTRRIAKQMCDRYPLTLSNQAFGKKDGKSESSHLAEYFRQTVERFKHCKISTQHEFPISWHKLDSSVLAYLDGYRPLSHKEKSLLLKTVCADYLQWEHKSTNVAEDTRRIAKQMFEIYPSTLSNEAFGHEGGKTESSHLAAQLKGTVESFKRFERLSISSKETDALDSPVLNHRRKDVQSSSCSSTSECSVPATSTPDGFTIPWHELDKSLLNSLKRKKKLTPVQRGSLVAKVSRAYLLWENKTSDVSKDTRQIAQHMCKVYPLSLSDYSFEKACENPETGGSWYLAHLLWARVDLITKQQSKYFKGLGFLDTSEMQNLDEPSTAEGDKSAKSPLRDCDSPSNSSRGEFAIPWHKLDDTLLDALNKNKKLTLAQSWDLVLAVSEEFLQWNPDSSNIDQYTAQIAEQMCEIYPSSLSNNALGTYDDDTPGSALACMLKSKVWDLKNDGEQKSQSSSSSDNNEIPQLLCMEEMSEVVSEPNSPCPDQVEDPSSPLMFDFGAFSIPWNKLDTTTLNGLKKSKRLSRSSKINMVHVICHEFLMWHPNLSDINLNDTCRIIAKHLVKLYPKSLSSVALGKPGAQDSSSILFNSFKSRFTVLRRYKAKKEEDQNSHEHEGDSEVLEWAINFRIPWEKMSQELLESLKNKESLPPTLRSELVRIVSGDIQKIEESPNKGCVDYIAREMCTMYPKSLGDLSCTFPADKHEFLGREILWKIQRDNHANKRSDQEESKEKKSFDSLETSNLEPIETLSTLACPSSIVEVELEVDDSSPSSIPTSYPSTEDPSYHAGFNCNITLPQPYLPDVEVSPSADQNTDDSTPSSSENQGIEDTNCDVEAGIHPSTVVPDCSTKSPDDIVADSSEKSVVSPDDVTGNCGKKKVAYFAEVVKSSDERCAMYINKPVNKGNNIIFLPRDPKDSEEDSHVAKYPTKTYSRNGEAKNISAKAATSSSDIASDYSMSANTVSQNLSKKCETYTSKATSDYYPKSVTYQTNVVSGCNANPVTYQSSAVSDCSTNNLSLPSTESSSYNSLPMNVVIQPNSMIYPTNPSYINTTYIQSTYQNNVVQNLNIGDAIYMGTNQMAYPVNVSSNNPSTFQPGPAGSSAPYVQGYKTASQYLEHLSQSVKNDETEQDLRIRQNMQNSYWKF